MKTMAKVLAVAMNVYCTMPPCALHSVVPSICRYQGIMAAYEAGRRRRTCELLMALS